MTGKRGTVEERFWPKVAKSDTGCWLWTGARSHKSYGELQVFELGRPVAAHRISWILHFGPIPPGKLVCHHCDNPPCVRPDHLFLGGKKENALDMVAKRPWPPVISKGEDHGGAKLTAQQVSEIRERFMPLDRLAGEYGVTKSTIWSIVNHRTWRHI